MRAVRVTPKTRRSVRARGTGTAELIAEVETNEDAVVLVEQDGTFAWLTPSARTPLPAPTSRRERVQPRARRQITFSLRLPESELPDGLGLELGLSAAETYVFKFAAHLAAGNVVRFLERHVREGLVRIPSADPASWSSLEQLGGLRLPRDRRARVLLLIHGTFSSTAGSFGALGASAWGRAFLDAALASYDAVMGYDHRTLSEDPLENATELLRLVRTAPQPVSFDAIAYSRGGLVLRSFIEQVLPNVGWDGRVERAIFLACANSGSALAYPSNWHGFADLYTNLAVAAMRGLALLPGATVPATIFAGLIQGVGTLVKVIATEAGGSDGVRGLAAMNPEGAFIRALNEQQPGQPAPADSSYYAVTSDFQPQLGAASDPQEFPQSFLRLLRSGVVEQIMHAPNDLLVDVASMTAIDPQIGGFVKDTLDFGPNPHVYHTNYLSRPEVTNAFARWLRLRRPATANGGGERSVPAVTAVQAPPPETVAAGATVTSDLPVAVDTDIVTLEASDSTTRAAVALEAAEPSYVVVHRDNPHPYPGEPLDLHYAYTGEEVDTFLKQAGAGYQTLERLLQMHEYDRAGAIDASGLGTMTPRPGGGYAARDRHVVFDGDRPVGVKAKPPLASSGELGELAKKVAAPAGLGDRSLRRRAMPSTASARGHGASVTESPTPDVASRPTRFHAEIDAELVRGETSSVDVTVSFDQLITSVGRVGADAAARLKAELPLKLQLVPCANVEPRGPTRVDLAAPKPGDRQIVSFDIAGTDLGEARVWVLVRQEQVVLLTLELKARVVLAHSGTRLPPVTAVGSPPIGLPPTQPQRVLRVTQSERGSGVIYQYELFLADQNELKLSDSPLLADRVGYVNEIYKQIEDRWISTQGEVNAFREALRAIGAKLFTQLFTLEFQQILWDHRNEIDGVLVLSTEPFIPWELVHLKVPGSALVLGGEGQFLGEKGLVRWLHRARQWAPASLRIRPGKVRYIVPTYPGSLALAGAAAEGVLLATEYGATVVSADPNAVTQLLNTPGSFDLLHFAGHGSASIDNISAAAIYLTGRINPDPPHDYIWEPFTATSVEEFADLIGSDGSQPIVVLNACQAGRTGYQLSSMGGFAQAFLERGAGVFVSSLWSVGDQPAGVFAEQFYARLRAGDTLTAAVRSARSAAFAAGDATWLAYAVYGLPDATVDVQVTPLPSASGPQAPTAPVQRARDEGEEADSREPGSRGR